jgi:hypothetical protein
MVANSDWLDLECGELGAAGLSDGRAVYPRRNSYHVYRDGGQDMLQVSVGRSSVAETASFDGLRMGTLDAGAYGIRRQIPTKVRNVPQKFAGLGVPPYQIPTSEPHPGRPFRPIPTRDAGRPPSSSCFRGWRSAESEHRRR